MSREGLEKFSAFMAKNKECREKAKNLGDDFNALAAYAAELGYDVSSAELQKSQEQVQRLMKAGMQKLQESQAALSPGAKEFYKFIELSEQNEEVAARLAELGSGSKEELIAYGKEKGFIFNDQDIKDVTKNILQPKDELSEEELEQVAGGIVLGGLAIAALFMAVGAGGALAVGVVGGAVALVTGLDGYD